LPKKKSAIHTKTIRFNRDWEIDPHPSLNQNNSVHYILRGCKNLIPGACWRTDIFMLTVSTCRNILFLPPSCWLSTQVAAPFHCDRRTQFSVPTTGSPKKAAMAFYWWDSKSGREF
jgi:hypothetical protein